MQFPGSNCDDDVRYVVQELLAQQAVMVWHSETSLGGADAVIIPGGFSYGDYLRAGALASHSPVMAAVKAFAAEGGPVLGICNGFQVLTEAGLLPGVLVRNPSLHFRCRPSHLRVEGATPFTSRYQPGQLITLPIAHNEGGYYADEATVAQLEAEGRVVFRYAGAGGEVTAAANPNGSVNNIAGIVSSERNVVGLMPHPERATEALLGSVDGLPLFESLLEHLHGAVDGAVREGAHGVGPS